MDFLSRLSNDKSKGSIPFGVGMTVISVLSLSSVFFAVQYKRALDALSKEKESFAFSDGEKPNKYAILRSKKDAKSKGGHQWHSASMADDGLSPEDQKIIDTYLEHQKKVASLSFVEEARKLFESNNGFGILSTLSKAHDGVYPTGSMVSFAIDDRDGLPFFCFSIMSTHRTDIDARDQVCLSVCVDGFKDANDARCGLIGTIDKVSDTDVKGIDHLRSRYMQRHKGATWINFKDFAWYKFKSIEGGKYVGGFAAAHTIVPKEFLKVVSDPHVAYANVVMNHMNDDHADSLIDIVQHQCGLPVSNASMISFDRLGMFIRAHVEIANGGYTKVRIGWPTEINDRKTLKESIIGMARTAGMAKKASQKVK